MNLAAEDPVPAIPVPRIPGEVSGESPDGRHDLLWRPPTRGLKLYNAGDVDGYANEYTEDAVLTRPDGTVEGRTAIRDRWAREKVAFPDRTLTADVLLEQGDTIAAEWTWAATNTGPLTLRDGTQLPPTGKRIEITGMELAQLRDGKISAHRMYRDGMAIAQQLGLLPGPVR
jgi:predicted ester cyclase